MVLAEMTLPMAPRVMVWLGGSASSSRLGGRRGFPCGNGEPGTAAGAERLVIGQRGVDVQVPGHGPHL